jgi:hypothetical protein
LPESLLGDVYRFYRSIPDRIPDAQALQDQAASMRESDRTIGKGGIA